MVYKVIVKKEEWFFCKNIYVKGHLFYKEQLYSEESLCDLLSNLEIADFDPFLQNVDGFFSFIIVKQNMVIAAVDHIRSFPLFYSTKERIITDNVTIDDLKKYDDSLLNQFENSFFMLSNLTICNEWKSVVGGSFLIMNKETSPLIKRYWNYCYSLKKSSSELDYINLLSSSYVIMIKKAIQYLAGRTAVIPLSGGHDSRLLLYLLVESGYKNIVTYTYGYKNNKESISSKNVAGLLLVPWYFVEYNPKKMNLLFRESFRDFAEYECNGVSIPQLQEWYAVYYLNKNHLVPDDSVFMPGHTGDLLSGDYFGDIHTINSNLVSANELCQKILSRHFRKNGKMNNYLITNCNYLVEKEFYDKEKAEELFERFNWEERQEKYILNSSKVYSFYGYDYFFPFNYKSQFLVWCSIPNEIRFSRYIFFKVEDYFYKNTKIKNVPFVRLHAKIDSKIVKKIKQIFLGRRNLHYAFGYFNFSIPRYYSLLVKHNLIDVNYYTQSEYLKLIRR